MVESDAGSTDTGSGAGRPEAIRSAKLITPSGVSPAKLMNAPTEVFALSPATLSCLSADRMIALAPQSLVTYSSSGWVSIVLTGLMTAPSRWTAW